MKTRLFSAIINEREFAQKFLADLAIVTQSSPKTRRALMDAVLDIAGTMTVRQTREVSEHIALDESMEISDAASALAALRFLTRELTREEIQVDSTEDLVTDLRQCAEMYDVTLSDSDFTAFEDVLSELRETTIPQYEAVRNRKATSTGVLPSLKSFGTTVELRAIVKNDFHIGMRSSEYDPKIAGLVPVVSVHIGTDSGGLTDFSFQASSEELDALIEELNAARIALSKMADFAKIIVAENIE